MYPPCSTYLVGICKISVCTSILGNDQKEHNLLQLCEAYFNAKPGGNVDPRGDPHGELKNQNHFTTIGIDKEKIIKDFGLENEAALNLKVKDIQEILYAERQKRPRPHLDNKILTSWNGLMISGFAVSGMALHRPDYIEKAVQAAEFIRCVLLVFNRLWNFMM